MEDFLSQIAEHREQFYRFVYRNVWDSAAADDVFAAAVLAAFENRRNYTPGTNFRAWMFRILVNKCFQANRECKRTPEPLSDETDERFAADPPTGHGDILKDPETFLQQCGDEVYSAFRRLSTLQRTCILLKDVERFSYQEISEVLEIPSASVMTHLARGRALLRELLRDYAGRAGILRKTPRIIPLKSRQEEKVATR